MLFHYSFMFALVVLLSGGSDKSCDHDEYERFFKNETDLKTIFDAKLGPDEIVVQLLGACPRRFRTVDGDENGTLESQAIL